MARKKKAKPAASDSAYLTIEQLSRRLQVHILTLYRWRRDGEGPKFVRFGRMIRYPRPEIERWEVARRIGA